MKRSVHPSKLAGSSKEDLRRKESVANRHEPHHDRVQGKLSAEKTVSSSGRSSRNFNGVSSGASPLSKGFLKESGRLKVAGTAATLASPLVIGTIVGGVAVGFYGIANMLRYKRNEKSGIRAAKDTITGSAGVGISTGLGVAAANIAVGAFGSMVLAPVATGAAVAYMSMAFWDKLFYTGKVVRKAS